MWKCSALLILLCLWVPSSALPEPPTPPASLSPEQEPLPSTSPLAQLLASATGARPVGSSSLAPPPVPNIRNKRKPFSFKSKGQSRFRPKSLRNLTQNTLGKPKSFKEVTVQDVTPRFSSFLKKPKPVAQGVADYKSENEQILTPTVQTTARPLQLTDFFGTPEPVLVQNRVAAEEQATVGPRHIPSVLGISKDINGDTFSDQRALFERLQSMTGAQAIGVTMDMAVVGENRGGTKAVVDGRNGAARGESSAELVENNGSSGERKGDTVRQRKGDTVRQRKGRRRGRVGGRRKVVKKKQEEENTESAERQGKELSFVKAPLRPRQKKSNFVRKKRNKPIVVTVDRYRYENEDGSITWGYRNDDGAFKEETIRMDCITQGKYGFTDSDGEKREYSYSSGVRCDPDSRKATHTDPNQTTGIGATGHGFYDYSENMFVMPSGRRVRVVVNQGNKARGRRY